MDLIAGVKKGSELEIAVIGEAVLLVYRPQARAASFTIQSQIVQTACARLILCPLQESARNGGTREPTPHGDPMYEGAIGGPRQLWPSLGIVELEAQCSSGFAADDRQMIETLVYMTPGLCRVELLVRPHRHISIAEPGRGFV